LGYSKAIQIYSEEWEKAPNNFKNNKNIMTNADQIKGIVERLGALRRYL
jgi:hypothetical protein